MRRANDTAGVCGPENSGTSASASRGRVRMMALLSSDKVRGLRPPVSMSDSDFSSLLFIIQQRARTLTVEDGTR